MSPLWGLSDNVRGSSWAHWKRVVDFLLVLNFFRFAADSFHTKNLCIRRCRSDDDIKRHLALEAYSSLAIMTDL